MKIFFVRFKNRLSAGIRLYPDNNLVEGIFQGETPFGGDFMRVKSVTGVPSEGLKLSTRVPETLR